MRPEGFWADPEAGSLHESASRSTVRVEWIENFRITDRDRALARHLARAGPATAMQAAAWLGRSEYVDDRSSERRRINKLVYCGWLRKMGWSTSGGGGTPPLVGPGALAQRAGVRVRWEWTPPVACRSVVLHQMLLRARPAEVRWRRQTPYGGLIVAQLRLRGREVAVAIARRGDWVQDRASSELGRCRDADGIWVVVPGSADLSAAVSACRAGGVLDRAAFATDVDVWRVGTPIADVWLVWSGETLQPGRLRALLPARSVGAFA